jgi:hypothetical protein
MRALTEQEVLSRHPLLSLPLFLRPVPGMRWVLADAVAAAIAGHTRSTTGINVHSACREPSENRSCVAGGEKMTQTGLED